jgi:hypothetical protein
MKRASHKGKGKGAAAPRREHFDDAEDDRSRRGYRIDDHMEVEFHDDRRDERGGDRGGDRNATRRDDPRDEEWDDRRAIRKDDPKDDEWDDHRATRKDDPRDEMWDDRRATRRDDPRDDARGQSWNDRRDDRREGVGEGFITQYFPTTGIEWEVIAGDIQIYLGPEASVRIGPDPDVRGFVPGESMWLLTYYRTVGSRYTGSRRRIIFLLRYTSHSSITTKIPSSRTN